MVNINIDLILQASKKLMHPKFGSLTEGQTVSVRMKVRPNSGPSLVIQWLRLLTSTAGGISSIPSQGTKIPSDKWYGQNKK